MELENNLIAGIYIPPEDAYNPCVGCKHLYRSIYGSPCEDCLTEKDGVKTWSHREEYNAEDPKP